MALILRAGLVASMIFIFLVVAPDSVLAGRTRLSDEEGGGVSEILLRGSSSVGLASPGDIDPGFSERKLQASRRAMETSEGGNDQPTKLDEQASMDTVPSAETQPMAPAPPARFPSKFASFFRSLAKGSPTPSTGTPSPGHN